MKFSAYHATIPLSLSLLHFHLESTFKIFTPPRRGQILSSSSPNCSFNYQELIKSTERKTGTQTGTWGQECPKGHASAGQEGSEGSYRKSYACQLLQEHAAEPRSLPTWGSCWLGHRGHYGLALAQRALRQRGNLG